MKKLPITKKQFVEKSIKMFKGANPGVQICENVWGPVKCEFPTGMVGYSWIFLASNGFRHEKMTATYAPEIGFMVR